MALPSRAAGSTLRTYVVFRAWVLFFVATSNVQNCAGLGTELTLGRFHVPLSKVLDLMNVTKGPDAYLVQAAAVVFGQSGTVIDAEAGSTIISVAAGGSIKFSNLTLSNSTLVALPAMQLLNYTELKKDSYSLPLPPSFLQLPWLNLSTGAQLQLLDVAINTDCTSLLNYHRYLCAGAWTSGITNNRTHIVFGSWASSGVIAANVSLTCNQGTTQTLVDCSMASAANEALLRSALELPQQTVLVVFVTHNLTLSADGSWSNVSTPVRLTGNVVLEGSSTSWIEIDLAERGDLFIVASVQSTFTVRRVVLSGLPIGPVNLPSPFPWFLTANYYVQVPPLLAIGGPYIIITNCNYKLPHDWVESLVINLDFLNSPSAQLRALVSWLRPFTLGFVVDQDQQGFVVAYSSTLRTINKQTRAIADHTRTCNLRNLTQSTTIRAPQLLLVASAYQMLQQVVLGSNAQDFDPPMFSLVLVNNVSFFDTAAQQWLDTNGTMVLNRSMIISRWGDSPTAIDFAWRSDIFTIVDSGAKVKLLDLILINLPRAYGLDPLPSFTPLEKIQLWGASLSPFNYSRISSSIMYMADMVLVVSTEELNFMYMLHTKRLRARPSPRLEMANDDIPIPVVLSDNGQVIQLRVDYIDGMFYESTAITITCVPPFNVSADGLPYPPSPVITLDMFKGAYGLSLNATNTTTVGVLEAGQDGSSDGTPGWQVAVVVVCSVLGFLLLVAAIVTSIVLLRRRSSRDAPSGSSKLVEDSGSAYRDAEGRASQEELAQRHSPAMHSYVPQVHMHTCSTDDGSTTGRSTGTHSYYPLKHDDLGVAAALEALRTQVSDQDLMVQDKIAGGASAEVYRGVWRGLDVAVKVMVLHDSRSKQAATREASILMNMAHPNIVSSYHYFTRTLNVRVVTADNSNTAVEAIMSVRPSQELALQTEEVPCRRDSLLHLASQSGVTGQHRCWALFLVQEFCSGGTLASVVDTGALQVKDAQDKGRFKAVLALAGDVARGMAHVHDKDVIHGDLKPGNVLLQAGERSELPGYTAKVSDFGLSMCIDASHTHLSNINQGTMFYTSPELIMNGRLSKAVDVYAFGVILWELYHGTPVWRQKRCQGVVHSLQLLQWAEHCPPSYTNLAKSCLAADPDARPTFQECIGVLKIIGRSMFGPGAMDSSSPGSGCLSKTPSSSYTPVPGKSVAGDVSGATTATLGPVPQCSVVLASGVSSGVELYPTDSFLSLGVK